MKRIVFACALAVLSAPAVFASDHNNIDAGRPLRFDDADPVALREQSLELGLWLGLPRRHPLGLGLAAEYLNGFALNSQASLGWSPSAGGRAGSRSTAFDAGTLSLGVLHQFNREIKDTPAFALRGDVYLPVGREARGADFRLRGILSRSVLGYDRLHLNLDLEAASSPDSRERQFNPGVVLGYSHPLGLPRQFTRTAVAELGVQAGPRQGTGPVVTLGIGLRQQVTVRSVIDLGLETDAASFNRAPGDRIRLIAGYSTAF